MIDFTDMSIMKNTRDRFYPGDRVRIREDTGNFCDDRPEQTFLSGTKGSIGVIVSYDEFRAYHENRLRQYNTPKSEGHEKFIMGVKETMGNHFRYPVKFEVVEPSTDAEAVICCRVGEIELIYVSRFTLTGEVLILEKIV